MTCKQTRFQSSTEQLLENGNKRHVEALGEILNDISKLVQTVEAEKITAKQNIDEIKTWVDGMETKINGGDEKI